MIKNKQTRRTIAVFFLLNFLSTVLPYNALYANNNGPNAPEASTFEPVNATDMVNLSSGDMAYVLPLIEVDGFPVTLSYHAGIPMDMDASWVGLGWNINTGSISRGIVSTPDDWNMGRSMKFTYQYFETETYTVNVGVGFGKAAEVGVGLSWGSNKSLSGSVSAAIGPISASIDTDGNYSVGLNTSVLTRGLGFDGAFDKPGSGGDGSPFGGSLSISGNVNKSGISVGLSAGYSKGGLNAGLGVSISGNGIGAGFSIGGGSGEGTNRGSAGAGGSVGSFSAADMNISSSGFYIPINIWIFNFGFGYQRQKITYKKGLNRYGFGSLYQKEGVFNTVLGERKDYNYTNYPLDYDIAFEDLQRRNFYGDIYDQELAQHEIDYIQDYRNPIEKINFTFAGYDNYGVNASGISGNLSPIIGENTVLIGEGFEGHDTDNSERKMKVFYHNSFDRETSTPTLNTDKSIAENNLYFAFNGQVMDYMLTGGSLGNYNSTKTSGLNLSDFARKSGSFKQRPTMGSFVEVFTNSQLDANPSLMAIPSTVYKEANNTVTILSRVEDLGYEKDGIGGYKITTPDGKTYHFAQPVYQYEKVEHNYIEIDKGLNISGLNSSSKRDGTPYATHWLLTAITGPDYIDNNNNNYPDESDYGYWLRLEHGQWSNAYAWRTPYADSDLIEQSNSITDNKNYRRYSTYNENNIDKADAGHFIQGRKDLYYLDKIVSRGQTAYFVKDIRKDGLGTDLDYIFTNEFNDQKAVAMLSKLKECKDNGLIDDIYYTALVRRINEERSKMHIGTAKSTFTDINGNDEIILGEEYASYEKEYLLRLDKIIIEKNKGSNDQVKTNVGNDNLGGIQSLVNNTPYDSSLNSNKGTLFFNSLPQAARAHKLHQINNVIDINDFENYDYSKALKVIKFSHDYSLAKQSPNSISPEKGRLTLNKVHFYGKDMYDYMPPYEFSYKKGYRYDKDKGVEEEVVFSRNDTPGAIGDKKEFNKKDSWGFIEGEDKEKNTVADTWSLTSIKTPQGSTIDITYEEDDYYVEAFSRRYWENYLKFQVKYFDPNGDILLDVYNDSSEEMDFTGYFSKGDEPYLDFWFFIGDRLDYGIFNVHTRTATLDIKNQKTEVYDVAKDKVTLKIKKGNYSYTYEDYEGTLRFIDDTDCYLSDIPKLYNCGEQPVYYNTNSLRGSKPSITKNDRKFTMNYKLLATKAPSGKSGGGLKVTKITVNDEAGAKYETTYDYRVPNLISGGFEDKSSGITSFYPIYGTTYVPYQNELPGPGVMYEWVTMKAKGYDATGKELPTESTRYHYYTLKPNFHIFDPGLTMKDNDGEVLFKATVVDVNIPKEKITAKDITIEKNLSKIGQLISIEQFNAEGHLLNKTVNSYTDKKGTYKETFTSMKSVYDYAFDEDKGDYTSRNLKIRALSKSTKIEKNKILNKVTSVTPYGTSSIEYDTEDPYIGSYRTSIKTKADGTKVKTTKYPAYERYPSMGPKRTNPLNKNMLTQEAMNVTSVEVSPYNWKTTNASVTTWNNEWTYRDEEGVEVSPTLENEKVWRKYRNYIWKGNVDENGTYGKNIGPYDFKWGVGDTQTNTEWKQVSEITRYTHYSMPVETKDINDNYAASKMADNWSKTIAGGNAKYTEMYYSGMEYTDPLVPLTFNSSFSFSFDNCSLGDASISRTGIDAVVVSSGKKAYHVNDIVGSSIEPGIYNVSYWLYIPDSYKDAPCADLILNGEKVASDSYVQEGNWKKYNYTINLLDGSALDMYITCNYASNGTIDDFTIERDLYVKPLNEAEGEFTFENAYITNRPHTGAASVLLEGNTKAFKLVVDSRDNSIFNGKKFRPGKYKVSYWLYNKRPDVPLPKLKYNNISVPVSEMVEAGDWSLINYIIDVNNESISDLYITTEGAVTSDIIDDFRMHPLASSMNSYVYDRNTDELRFILDANNLGTEFRYDGAGRLCKSYKEVVNDSQNVGGFKLIKKYRYRYKNAPSTSSNCNCCGNE